MTTETMNIHQALVELKTLEKRIEAAVKEGEWVTAYKRVCCRGVFHWAGR